MAHGKYALTKVQGIVIAAIVVIVVAAVAGYLLTQLQPVKEEKPVPPPSSIKVAFICSQTGGLAAEGRLVRFTVEEAVNMINREGGVYLKQYNARVPIELIVYDDESSAARATELANIIAANPEVIAVIHCSYAHIFVPAAKVFEKFGIPVLNGGTPSEFVAAGGPWNYTWNYGMSYEKFVKGFLELLEPYKNQTNRRFAVVLSDDVIGRTQKSMLIDSGILEKQGYVVAFPGLYPPGTTDFTAIITQIKDCDILWVHGIAPTFATFWRQCNALGYKPKIMYQSGGLARLEEVQALGGNLSLGIVTLMPWYYTYPYALSDKFKDVWMKYKFEKGIDLSPVAAYYFTVPYVLKDALERAGTLDRGKLNKAIAETNMEGAAGPVRYDPTTHTCSGLMCLGQWVKTPEGAWVLQPVWTEVPGVKVERLLFPIP